MNLFAFVMAFVAGALVTLQIASTSRLKEAVGATVPAAIASSLFGVVLLGAAMVVMQVPWPTFDRLISAPWSDWIGGAFGASYALVTIGLARHLGATTLVTLIVVGQFICSVVVDHFGVLGFEARAASFARLTG
jgi:bacterial/archaeal transporter family-2 protein